MSASAVRGTDGAIHMGLANVDPNQPATVSITLDGVTGASVIGRILTAATIDAHDTLDAPNAVVPVAFAGAKLEGNTLSVILPPKSLAMLDIK